MTRRKTILIIIFILPILFFGIYNYLISIYEVIYQVTPDNLYADDKSEITIEAVPINAIGSRALFRQVEAAYTITDGAELVNIIEENLSGGTFKLKAKDKAGVIKITAKSRYALAPSPIIINIYPNIVEVLHEVNRII